MRVDEKALQLYIVYKKPYFVTRESVSVLQVTQESVSGTTSHVDVAVHSMKLKDRMIKSLSP